MQGDFAKLRGDAPLVVYIDLKSPYAYLAIAPTRAMAAAVVGVQALARSRQPTEVVRLRTSLTHGGSGWADKNAATWVGRADCRNHEFLNLFRGVLPVADRILLPGIQVRT